MFSFYASDYPILEANVPYDTMQEEYPDNYMVVMNGRVVDKCLHGDIVAFLTEDEYEALEMPNSIAPKFSIIEGVSILQRRAGNSLGIYL
jgi:hypothetical protein